MITLYSWPTPNGKKVSIALEELGLPYEAVPINIGKGDQFSDEFLRMSPNGKIPAILDTEGPDGQPIALFESGAILLYLAEKTGKLMPMDPRSRMEVMQWLMFQMGGFGPLLGQAHHFRLYAPEPIPYAINRYTQEAHRLYGVLDRHLAGQTSGWVAARQFSIADIAIYGWVLSHEHHGVDLENFPAVKAWAGRLAERPATARGAMVMAELRKPLTDAQSRALLFGQK